MKTLSQSRIKIKKQLKNNLMPLHYFHSYAKTIDSIFGISAGLLGVFATTILGILALFGNQIRSYFFRPDLQAVDGKRTSQSVAENIDGLLYNKNYTFQRLIVKNIGKVRARDVRVLLTYEKGNQKELKNFIPIPLNWTHWNKTSRDISRGEPAYVDIFRKREDEKNYRFCWSQETGYSIEPLLINFYPQFGDIRLEFFGQDSKIGDIYLRYNQNQDILEIVNK